MKQQKNNSKVTISPYWEKYKFPCGPITIKFEGLSHTVKQPTVENLKDLEVEFPDQTMVDSMGEIKTSKNMDVKRKLALWNMIIQDAAGYFTEGDKPDTWKASIPPLHKLGVINEVNRIKTVSKDDIAAHFLPDLVMKVSPTLVNIYGVANNNGSPQPLAFQFIQPTEESLEKYIDITTMQQRMKNKHFYLSGKPHSQGLVELFDLLIDQVIGYDTNEPYAIPSLHKIVAVTELFSQMTESLREAEGN